MAYAFSFLYQYKHEYGVFAPRFFLCKLYLVCTSSALQCCSIDITKCRWGAFMKKTMLCLLLSIISLGLIGCWNKAIEEDLVSLFENSVFIGDSVTEGFAFNEILSQEQVIAGAGATAGFSYDDVDVLMQIKPEYVFIMFGSVDLLMPVNDPQKLFRTDLTKLINKIKELTPYSEIYLQSITPVTEAAIIAEPRYGEIEKYNQIIREVAHQLKVHYVDIGALIEANPDLYAEDGVHFKKEFYQLWLEQLAEVMLVSSSDGF